MEKPVLVILVAFDFIRGGVFPTLQAIVEAAAIACRIRWVKIGIFADHIIGLSGEAVHGCRIASRSIYADRGAF